MLRDPRIDQLAGVLLRHSLALEKGEIYQINASIAAKPLVGALYRESLQLGVFPIIQWHDEEISRLRYGLLDPAGEDTARFLELGSRWEQVRWQDIAARLTLHAPENDQELNGVDLERIKMVSKADEPWFRTVIDERKWALFYWPTAGLAQKAGMPTEDFLDFTLAVSLIDYKKLYQAELKLASRLEAADQVRILAPGTDLTFSIRGLPAVCCYGRRNVPDGEVYTAPVRDSANGRITYNVEANLWGTSFKRICLEFSAGKIVQATCDGDHEALNRIFDTDEGARYLGEFSFGVNPLLTRPTGSTLFDEKITGSIHLTPGNAYAKADNGNKSLIHWDLIQIQQPIFGGGEIWLDGSLVRRDGLFVPEDLSGLNPASL